MKYQFILLITILCTPLSLVGQQTFEGDYYYHNTTPHYRDFTLNLESSGYFVYSENYYFCCTGGCPPTPVAVGRWEQTEDAILLRKIPAFYLSSIKNLVIEEVADQEQVTISINNRAGKSVKGFRLKLFYKDSNDFELMRTDENGVLEVPAGVYGEIYLFSANGSQRALKLIALDFDGGANIKIDLWLNMRYQTFDIPNDVVIAVKADGSLEFEGFNDQFTFKKRER